MVCFKNSCSRAQNLKSCALIRFVGVWNNWEEMTCILCLYMYSYSHGQWWCMKSHFYRHIRIQIYRSPAKIILVGLHIIMDTKITWYPPKSHKRRNCWRACTRQSCIFEWSFKHHNQAKIFIFILSRWHVRNMWTCT